MYTKPEDLVDNIGVLNHCRHVINERFRSDDWRELYITSIIRFKDMYIVKYGVVLENEEEFHNTIRIEGV